MNEKQTLDDPTAAFREVVSILEKNGRYLEVVGLKPATREAYKKTVAYLKRMDVDEIENLLRPKRKLQVKQKRFVDPDVRDDELRSLSPEQIRKYTLSGDVSRKFLERIARFRFGMTSGALLVHGNRAALVDKLNTLLGHEGTHQAITRAIASDTAAQRDLPSSRQD